MNLPEPLQTPKRGPGRPREIEDGERLTVWVSKRVIDTLAVKAIRTNKSLAEIVRRKLETP